ncbi:hypothetical protein A3A74_06495 [Candidatus Roizmanbacteria bacterium RIFCSPLOWO2_01_FULL_35_13]|uniref:DUF3800 domain-containing protein n=2 Tax=Microgenomates group TaxID=1794810 RepID=A0A1F7IFJ2_9BACT|nr:MAG: hypothetical protein A3A74_06495 [Candidatus Roizmanbacteria bacterium RIFCSPLOWO2_01_FULL_35_13]
MQYLYLDESGDLGFDFVNKKPTKFFTVAILAVNGVENNRKLIKGVKVTLRRKLNPKKHRRRIVQELKGKDTTLEIKQYFYKQISKVKFEIYAMTLNKKRVYDRLTKEKSRVYNFIARQVIDKIPFEKNKANRVELVIDKSKSKPEIEEFNSYIRSQIQGRLDPKVTLDMYHWDSQQNPPLQAADMFCWGIFQKYQRRNTKWFEVFEKKIIFEGLYLKG